MASNRAIPPEIFQEISRRLADAEREHRVRILYCCESGSRAWGFASPDSDYDVRFIYVHEEDWYLSFDIERRRDVIEYPIVDEIDCSGWDLRKALYLFTRTNGALLEWLNSPVCYIERGNFAAKLRYLAPRAINKVALCYHYSHIASKNARKCFFRDQVKLKKYFYVLRPLLAIRYIEAGKGLPPVEFEQLVETVAPPAIRQGIASLLETKRCTPELGLGEPLPAINAFIAAETERHETAFHEQERPDMNERAKLVEELNVLFRETIREKSST
ncbi:MAG: nucleotidyltransferase domain-containing protein [Candidatus Electrothrix gigas]